MRVFPSLAQVEGDALVQATQPPPAQIGVVPEHVVETHVPLLHVFRVFVVLVSQVVVVPVHWTHWPDTQ